MSNLIVEEHKIECITCLPVEPNDTPRNAECPQSGTLSGRIQQQTVEEMVKPEFIGSISNSQYYYCDAADCPVVYFTPDSTGTFTKGDLQVAVYDKDPGKDVNVCYCFEWTRARITDQIKATGSSMAYDEISEEMNAGNCECDVKNPKGACCLGDINKFAKEIA